MHNIENAVHICEVHGRPRSSRCHWWCDFGRSQRLQKKTHFFNKFKQLQRSFNKTGRNVNIPILGVVGEEAGGVAGGVAVLVTTTGGTAAAADGLQSKFW